MQRLDITINGVKLTEGQALTVHVALQTFATDLTRTKHPCGDDRHGKFMTEAYLKNINSINQIYIK